MFKNNLALAIKVDGKVLKEIDGKVYLPFGSEYTIFLKNTSNKRCRVKISVDGDDILDGTRIIVDSKSTSEIKRFIRNANFNEGNSLKFIEKTDKISEYRGNKIEDGLVTVDYEFEYSNPYVPTWDAPYQKSYHSNYSNSGLSRSFQPDILSLASIQGSAGITTAGSHNNQKFELVSWNGSEPSKHSMTIQLLGKIETENPVTVTPFDELLENIEKNKITNNTSSNNRNIKNINDIIKEYIESEKDEFQKNIDFINDTIDKMVEKAITTNTKVTCNVCGTKSKTGTKFCSECGTSLKLY